MNLLQMRKVTYKNTYNTLQIILTLSRDYILCSKHSSLVNTSILILSSREPWIQMGSENKIPGIQIITVYQITKRHYFLIRKKKCSSTCVLAIFEMAAMPFPCGLVTVQKVKVLGNIEINNYDFVIPLRAKRVGEFIEIRNKKFHPPVY